MSDGCLLCRSGLAVADVTERTQVKAYLRVTSDIKHPLHNKVGREYTSRLKRGREWMQQAADTISQCIPIEDVRRGTAWQEITDETEQFTHVISSLGRECREWAPGATNAEIEATISEISEQEDGPSQSANHSQDGVL